MTKCVFDKPTLNQMFDRTNGCKIVGRVYSETGMAFFTHVVAAYLIGQKVLKPGLIGATSILSAYSLAISDHLYFQSEEKAHQRSHRFIRAVANMGITYLVSRHIISVNWKWPVMSVSLTTYFCELEKSRSARRN
ncbi:hypothetical protein [Candidatus Neptunichlamydia sp. REUL1]|uniref:hypothetical protein n=1 Tax=Candidatus Neptunichlamydia sp. REUL1 TaxID=3064277 RepID=UPI00292F62A2|nr:hypothetical protein [Candidatus Neptunochlamydia sp. REUL1]